MEERNKDLPLIVSEMLIEMHELRGEITEVKTTLTQMASLMLRQQQQSNDHFRLLMEENRRNTEMIVEAFKNEAALTRQLLDQHDARLSRLEDQ